ncbi:TadE/TadG family type IV pilus assembly protein [Rubripirellula reticaptiva]|uniref:TadE-like protein n=1 Tax=Rubripirellula reticaptiva TaxID=2528013 RepID=A0A5C6EK02_9BACT|nr:TadE/TadG family type IV pilus assembly protein [Rubripirellula reticaptiva]TWU49382.1 TadE-like protein [Rubripirellula reticaptiva]
MPHPLHPKRRARSHRRRGLSRLGVSSVEFAIIANILLLIILTCMEFARMNMVRNLSQDAAYYAARVAIVPGATSEEAVNEASRIMGSLLNNGYEVNVSSIGTDSTSVTVTVTVDMGEVALFAPFFLPTSDLSSTVRMRTERYDGFYEQ